jgi:hypothetical protein
MSQPGAEGTEPAGGAGNGGAGNGGAGNGGAGNGGAGNGGAADATGVLDLATDEPATAIARPVISSTQTVGPGKPIEDLTRLGLAGGLLLILAILVIGTGWVVANYPGKEKAIEAFLKLTFTPVVGLVGSVVGFYFGSRTGSNGSS